MHTSGNGICQYVMEVIFGNDNPKLELVCMDDKCPIWIAESIIKTVCKSLCDVGSYTASISKENLQKECSLQTSKTHEFFHGCHRFPAAAAVR